MHHARFPFNLLPVRETVACEHSPSAVAALKGACARQDPERPLHTVPPRVGCFAAAPARHRGFTMNRFLAAIANVVCWCLACAAIGAPQVTEIDMFELSNTTIANTTQYKTPVEPRLVIRRAQKYVFVITTNKEAPQANWNIFPSAKRVWDDTGVAIFPGPGLPPFPDDEWYFKVSPGYVGLDSQEFMLEISIPKDAEIGTYEFRIDANVTTIPASSDPGRIPVVPIQKIFPKHVVVLFNPWKANDTVYMPDAKDRQEYILNGDGNLVLIGPIDYAWQFNQFDEVTLNALTYFLDSTLGLDRTSPVLVTREIAGGCNWRDWTEGVLEGRWAQFFLPHQSPFVWKSSGEIFKKWMTGAPPYKPVKYGQCWVFSGISTSLLRAAGIPARPVSSIGTAIDNSEGPDGHIDLFFSYSPATLKYSRNFAKAVDGQWNYHVWTECWMSRPDLTGGDGWQVIDATSQAKGPKLTRIGPASRELIRNSVTPPADSFDAGFMWSSALADNRIYNESKILPGLYLFDRTDDNAKAKYGEFIWTKKRGGAGRVDIASEYRPAAPRPAPSEGERLTNPYFTVEFIGQDTMNTGQDVTGTVRITNGPGEPRTFYTTFGATLNFYNDDLVTMLADPDWAPNTLDPGQSIDLPLTIPAASLIPFMGTTHEFVRFFGAVNCEQVGIVEYITGGGGTTLTAPLLAISLNPPGPIMVNGVSNGVPAYTNTSGVTLTGVQLVWTLSSQLTFGGTQTLTVPLPDVPPTGSIPAISAPFYAVALGTGTVSASLECDQLPPSLASATIKVISCVGDFTGEGLVDDDDFVIFNDAYNAKLCDSPDMAEGCPGDLSSDGMVDEIDFELFAEAYSNYYCEQPPTQ